MQLPPVPSCVKKFEIMIVVFEVFQWGYILRYQISRCLKDLSCNYLCILFLSIYRPLPDYL